MGAWVGEMPVEHLLSGRIQPTEYRKWKHAAERFERREQDRRTVEDYKQRLKAGACPPIEIGRNDRYPEDLYVGDGHHRAVAAMQTGEPLPFRWYWITSWGVCMERGPFPFSELGLDAA